MGQLMTRCFICHNARTLNVSGTAIDLLNWPQNITVATIVQRNDKFLMAYSVTRSVSYTQIALNSATVSPSMSPLTSLRNDFPQLEDSGYLPANGSN